MGRRVSRQPWVRKPWIPEKNQNPSREEEATWEITHPEISQKAVSKSNLDQYLIENLGVSGGLEKLLNNGSETKKIVDWLTKGATDKRANLVFDDGKKFIEETDEKFDIILLDLSDPVGPAADLFQKKFHKKVYECLNEDGIMVAQSESPFFNRKTVKQMYKNLFDIFPIVKMYTCHMPIYPSALWSFAFCSKKYDPIDDFREQSAKNHKSKTKYYNAEVHRGSFALPQFARELLP